MVRAGLSASRVLATRVLAQSGSATPLTLGGAIGGIGGMKRGLIGGALVMLRLVLVLNTVLVLAAVLAAVLVLLMGQRTGRIPGCLALLGPMCLVMMRLAALLSGV